MANEKRLIAFDPITFEAFTRSLTKFRNPYDTYDDGYLDAVQRIEEWLESNTVDAVEVVRCKDCKHYGGVTFGYTCRLHSGSNTRIQMNENAFCAYGERRTDGNL